VVITILGILAAIVSISLLGVTANAKSKAQAAEKQNVQAAMDAMLSDQQVPTSAILADCDGTTGTKDMTQFPIGAVGYTAPDTGKMTVLATHYLREGQTNYTYACNANGDILQK
jgi:type II secretory pathway pseudopilin PulG